MSTSLRLLSFITHLLIQFVIVSSFPGPGSLISPRQSSCDSLVCPPSLEDFVGGAQNLWNDVLGVGAGVAGWVIDKSTGLLVPQPVEPESKTKPNNGNAPAADPMYQPGPLDTPQDQCTATSDSNPSDGTGQESVEAQSCGSGTLQLVWTVNCDNAGENSAMEVTLKAMDSQAFAVTSPDCESQKGVWFWVGKFTPEQIESIKEAVHVVKAVEPDLLVKSDFRLASTGNSHDPSQFQKDLTTVPTEEEFSLQRRTGRGDRTVSVRKSANPALAFLSTGPGKQPSDTYTSFTPSYGSVKIIVIELGVTETDPEIAGFIRHVVDTRAGYPHLHYDDERLHENQAEDDFRGTCIASMIGSSKNGVAKLMYHSTTRRLTVVKIDKHIWSFLAGLKDVYSELNAFNTKTAIGYNVLVIPVGIPLDSVGTSRKPRVALSWIRDMLHRMIVRWQVVIVVAAGTEDKADTNTRQTPRLLNSYPALFADELLIILVAAVDVFTGDNSLWSYYGSRRAISGPAQGYCLGENPVGTSVASAYVGGLIAYLLSLPDVGAHLRESNSVPTMLHEYLTRMSYSRSPSDQSATAVWNGLDASDAKKTYSFWIGDPAQDVEIPQN